MVYVPIGETRIYTPASEVVFVKWKTSGFKELLLGDEQLKIVDLCLSSALLYVIGRHVPRNSIVLAADIITVCSTNCSKSFKIP